MAVQAVPTATAKRFRHTVGVATHPTFFDTVHAKEPEIAKAIAKLGIRHVRNEMSISNDAAWNRTVWANMKAWGEAGVQSSWRVDRCAVNHPGNTHTSIREYLDKIAELDPAPTAIEGTNEVDQFCTGGFPAAERDWVKRLYGEVKAHPKLGHLPVIGPSFAHSSERQLGDMSAWLDYGNTHPYSGGDTPTADHVHRDGIVAYKPAGQDKPIVVTEVGYHTAVNAAKGDGQPPTDERTQAIYTVRTVLEHFAAGIVRTYFYEAVDLFPDQGRKHPESCFGLLRNDLSLKPAATALKRLLAATGTGAPKTVTPLQVGIDRQPPDMRLIALQRLDRSWALVVWRTNPCWDRDARKRIPVPIAPVSLKLPQARRVTYTSTTKPGSAMPLELKAGATMFPLDDDPVVIRVYP